MSSFLGRHKYRTRDETIREIYERYISKTYECVEVTLPEELQTLTTQRCLTEKDYQTAEKMDPICAKKGDVEITVDPTQQLAIARGVALENTVLEELNQLLTEENTGWTVRPHCQTHIKVIDGLNIVGQVDGLIYDEDDKLVGVVEIKNRLRGFFNHSKLEAYKYDIDQLMCYHQIFLKGQPATHMLVQCYNGKLQVSYYTSEYMESRWKSIRHLIPPAIDRYDQLLSKYQGSSSSNLVICTPGEKIGSKNMIHVTHDPTRSEYPIPSDT